MTEQKENTIPQVLEDDAIEAVSGGLLSPPRPRNQILQDEAGKAPLITPEDLEKLQELLREQPPAIRPL